jgi:hypothetical protein
VVLLNFTKAPPILLSNTFNSIADTDYDLPEDDAMASKDVKAVQSSVV